jgi:hypothetical protein
MESSQNKISHLPQSHLDSQLSVYVSFCLMKKDRRCDNCQVQVMPMTMSWMMIHRMTRELVDSDWSLKSASRS